MSDSYNPDQDNVEVEAVVEEKSEVVEDTTPKKKPFNKLFIVYPVLLITVLIVIWLMAQTIDDTKPAEKQEVDPVTAGAEE